MKGKSHQRWKKNLVIHSKALDNNKQAYHNLQRCHRDLKALQKFQNQMKVSQSHTSEYNIVVSLARRISKDTLISNSLKTFLRKLNQLDPHHLRFLE